MKHLNTKIIFSVIIPTIKTNNYLLKCLDKLCLQKFKNFELILISENILNIEKKYNFNIKKIYKKNILTPGKKRNYAAKFANGEYLAFIDDDAFPKVDWLEKAYKFIKKNSKKKSFLLGGPGILPNNETFFSKLIDLSFRSRVFGSSRYRYSSIKNNLNTFDDWPSVNMIVGRKLFLKLKGFDNNFWPGEDSKFCNRFIKNGGKIIYLHNMIVYHYRRSSFLKHFSQIFKYAFTRGTFFQNRDKNSFKFSFLLPSLFNLYIVISLVMLKIVFFIPLSILLIFIFCEFYFKNLKILSSLIVSFLVLANLSIYGFAFLLSFIFFGRKVKLGR